MVEKRLEVKVIEDAMNILEKAHNSQVSARQFVEMNFERLEKSGKSLKFLHRFLHSHGIDVGTYNYFRGIYNSEKCRIRGLPAIAPLPAKTTPMPPGSMAENPTNQANSAKVEQGQNVETSKAEKPLLYGQRPILRPDGIEYYIDPETGAKHFKIERTKPTL